MASYDKWQLKITVLFGKAILLTMFVYGDCMTVCSNCIHLSATIVDEIAESIQLKGCPHTFVCIVYLKKRLGHGSENQSLSGVITFCLMKHTTSPSHRVDQAVECGLWNVVPLFFNGCA